MNNIKNLRNKKGLSANELSKKTGIPKRTIEDWEDERRQIQYYHRMKMLCDVLECDIDELMTKEEKATYQEEYVIVYFNQEEQGVLVTLLEDSDDFEDMFQVYMPRENALELLNIIKEDKDIAEFLGPYKHLQK